DHRGLLRAEAHRAGEQARAADSRDGHSSGQGLSRRSREAAKPDLSRRSREAEPDLSRRSREAAKADHRRLLLLRRNQESYAMRPHDTAKDTIAESRGATPSPCLYCPRHHTPNSTARAAERRIRNA